MSQSLSGEKRMEMMYGGEAPHTGSVRGGHSAAAGFCTLPSFNEEAPPEISKDEAAEAIKKKRTNRMVVWEVSIARGCIESFNRMLTAHAIVLSLLATVNLVAFFQPPRGWSGDTGHMFPHSKALIAFSLFNSGSVYFAVCGLLFYVYCCHSAIFSPDKVPLPGDFDDDPEFAEYLLHSLRATLRRVTLPCISRRCGFLFFFLASSITCCMVSYISAGLAATNPGEIDRWVGVILPAFPGCAGLLFLLLIAVTKAWLELNFNSRFKSLWSSMAAGNTINDPGVRAITRTGSHAVDPLPWIFRCCYDS